ncbi:hypothetical protein HDU93_001802, partial [Gonapodya sp. JEL0774]
VGEFVDPRTEKLDGRIFNDGTPVRTEMEHVEVPADKFNFDKVEVAVGPLGAFMNPLKINPPSFKFPSTLPLAVQEARQRSIPENYDDTGIVECLGPKDLASTRANRSSACNLPLGGSSGVLGLGITQTKTSDLPLELVVTRQSEKLNELSILPSLSAKVPIAQSAQIRTLSPTDTQHAGPSRVVSTRFKLPEAFEQLTASGSQNGNEASSGSPPHGHEACCYDESKRQSQALSVDAEAAQISTLRSLIKGKPYDAYIKSKFLGAGTSAKVSRAFLQVDENGPPLQARWCSVAMKEYRQPIDHMGRLPRDAEAERK